MGVHERPATKPGGLRPSLLKARKRSRALKDIPLNYRAKMEVREKIKTGDANLTNLMSQFSSDTFEVLNPFLKAGITHDSSRDAYFITWKEDVLVFPGLRVAAKKFDMHPLQTQLDITKSGARAFVDVADGAGHHCLLATTEASKSLGKLVSQASGFRPAIDCSLTLRRKDRPCLKKVAFFAFLCRLVVLKQERGKVLRQWRMDASASGADVLRLWQFCKLKPSYSLAA